MEICSFTVVCTLSGKTSDFDHLWPEEIDHPWPRLSAFLKLCMLIGFCRRQANVSISIARQRLLLSQESCPLNPKNVDCQPCSGYNAEDIMPMWFLPSSTIPFYWWAYIHARWIPAER